MNDEPSAAPLFPTFRAAPKKFLGIFWSRGAGKRAAVLQQLSRAQLPDALQRIVLDTCTRTKLTPAEQGDVARELTNHFQEGLHAGRTAPALADDFGDATQAAALIRRAKLRCRPPISRTLRFVRLACGWGFVAFLGLYGLSAARFFLADPKLTRNYTREMNNAVAKVPEEQRAWPVYRRALIALPPTLATESKGSWPHIATNDPAYPEAVAYIKAAAPALELVRHGATLAALGAHYGHESIDFELETSQMRRRGMTEDAIAQSMKDRVAPVEPENAEVIAILLPHLGYARNLARHLVFDMDVAFREKDAARGVADIEAMVGIAQQLSGESFLISQLVAFAVFNLASNEASRAVALYGDQLSNEQLTSLAHSFATCINPGRLRTNMSAEQTFFDDLLQRAYSDNGHGDGVLTNEGLKLFEGYKMYFVDQPTASSVPSPYDKIALNAFGPVYSQLTASRAEMSREYQRIMSGMMTFGNQEPWVRIAQGEPSLIPLNAKGEREPAWSFKYNLVGEVLPALAKSYWSADATSISRDATCTVFAMELYKREHKQWPRSLSELSPKYLPKVPLDIMNGEPLKLELTPSGPILYGVGGDMDDDHGKRPENDVYVGSPAAKSDGDWIFFPPGPEPKYDAEKGY